MATDIKLTSQSELKIKEVKNIDSVDIHVKEVNKIDPVAVHLKEINHIDPISIDNMHISEVKNIEPLDIATFNITKLPMVNVSLQKLPPLDVNLRSLPPISVGTYQKFLIPSNYTLRARFLGIELFRLNLEGKTSILPKQSSPVHKYKDFNKSYSEAQPVSEPAVHCKQTTTNHCVQQAKHHPQPPHYCTGSPMPAGHKQHRTDAASLSFGKPSTSFQLQDEPVSPNLSESHIMSGD